MSATVGVLVILILILIAVGVGMCRAMGYFRDHASLRFSRALVSDTLFRPGDLLFFSAHVHGFSNSVFTMDFYSHSAIVVQDPNTGQLYVSEATLGGLMPDPSDPDAEIVASDRAQLVPLFARLKYYPGIACVARLEPGLRREESRRLWSLAQEKTPYPSFSFSLARMFRLLGGERRGSQRHCMSHVAWLLDELGLTPTELLGEGKLLEEYGFLAISRAVTTIDGQPLGPSGDRQYATPVQLLYDLDCVSG